MSNYQPQDLHITSQIYISIWEYPKSKLVCTHTEEQNLVRFLFTYLHEACFLLIYLLLCGCLFVSLWLYAMYTWSVSRNQERVLNPFIWRGTGGYELLDLYAENQATILRSKCLQLRSHLSSPKLIVSQREQVLFMTQKSSCHACSLFDQWIW